MRATGTSWRLKPCMESPNAQPFSGGKSVCWASAKVSDRCRAAWGLRPSIWVGVLGPDLPTLVTQGRNQPLGQVRPLLAGGTPGLGLPLSHVFSVQQLNWKKHSQREVTWSSEKLYLKNILRNEMKDFKEHGNDRINKLWLEPWPCTVGLKVTSKSRTGPILSVFTQLIQGLSELGCNSPPSPLALNFISIFLLLDDPR